MMKSGKVRRGPRGDHSKRESDQVIRQGKVLKKPGSVIQTKRSKRPRGDDIKKSPRGDDTNKSPRADGIKKSPRADDIKNYVPVADHPKWAEHVASVLKPFLRTLPQLCQPCLRLNVWADCAGMCSEMCSVPHLVRALRELIGVEVEIILHGGCDSCRRSKKFVLQNYNPAHWSDDVGDRDWETGAYTDSKVDPAVTGRLPQQGIGIYLAGWPCGPWSHRGARKRGQGFQGWHHMVSDQLDQADQPCLLHFGECRSSDRESAGRVLGRGQGLLSTRPV